MTTPLQKAIDICGGAPKMALALGLHKTACYSWETCPSDRVLAVSEATNWKVTPHELRPDLYPNPTDALPEPVKAAA